MTSCGPTVGRLLHECEDLLAAAGVDSPRLSAQVLAAHALGLERHALLLARSRPLEPAEAARVRALVRRRAGGEPVAYITGVREFYGLEFAVGPAVLVPRPETEHLLEQAEALFARDAPLVFADLGTGSGCLAVALAHRFARARGLALDASAPALAVARANARRHGVAARLQLLRADFGRPFAAPGSLDLVLANPPYVSQDEYQDTSREVRDFEPRTALVPEAPGRADGLECYRALAPRAAEALRPGGALLAEIGCGQGAAVRAVVLGTGAFAEVRVLPDLAGLDRVVAARRV
ncbi:peptide chain release factor N(5)-glutamine methyltransferase [Desulfocurvus vexinensis]|uniref:peptide chain release factor N(5)-glutamine methyltransferase n=1 Tax=Desulfocurvus vexinensis TaxID=399548 RepID=UPI0004B3A6CB|nr:peptide chain release factor N(5)-glutamine methyltransferase [Desulfocurvus vexinensis]